MHSHLGAYGSPGAVNGSIGIVVHFTETKELITYLGFGCGVAALISENDSCPSDNLQYSQSSNSDSRSFGWGAVGFSVPVGAGGKSRFAIDAGAWYGRHDLDRGGATSSNRFVIPMLGATLLFGL
jgi:hypothetical protein